jgi:hypothetical protein
MKTLPPDPKEVWQNQHTEKSTMSIEEVRLKADILSRKTRRDTAAAFAFDLVAIVFCGTVIVTARLLPARMIAALVMVMMLVSLCRNLYFSYRKHGSFSPALSRGPDTAVSTCLEFYRSELERQTQIMKQPAWQLAVAFLVIVWLLRSALVRISGDPLRIVIPVVLLAAAGVLGLLTIRKIEARRVQEEIDALRRFEEER